MTIAFGITWNDSKRGRLTRIATASLVATLLLASAAPALERATEKLVSVIVRALPGQTASVESEIRREGGTVTRKIGIIDSVSAVVPVSSVPSLTNLPYVAGVTHNAPVRLSHAVDGFDGSTDAGSM